MIFMKAITPIIIIATLYLLVYTILSSFPDVPQNVAITMFSFSPLIVTFMVYRILKYGEPTELIFEESFYEDKGENRMV